MSTLTAPATRTRIESGTGPCGGRAGAPRQLDPPP